jgi:hypothetical protein
MKALTILTLISSLTFSSVMTRADEVVMPVISTPAALQEGLQRVLSQEQIAELLPWAKDSKIFMRDLIDGLENYNSEEKIEKLLDGIKYIVVESAPKNSELLMRYALNRGLALYDILDKEASVDAVGTTDAKLRVLIQSIKMAYKYADQDIISMTQKKPQDFASFGIDYFSFVCELNKTIIDASAQYLILRTSLEYLQWDLYRDLSNKEFSNHIVKINNALKRLPNKSLKDSSAISSMREMKRIIETLRLHERLAAVKVVAKK